MLNNRFSLGKQKFSAAKTKPHTHASRGYHDRYPVGLQEILEKGNGAVMGVASEPY